MSLDLPAVTAALTTVPDLPDRIRWPRTPPDTADYPETAPTWTTYR